MYTGRERLGRAEGWERGADADSAKTIHHLGQLKQGIVVLVVEAKERVLARLGQSAGGVELFVEVRYLFGDVSNLKDKNMSRDRMQLGGYRDCLSRKRPYDYTRA